MKKKYIFLFAVLLVILGGIYYIYDDNRIVSTLYLDINPSIKINLNKNEEVINVLALNEDAKKVVENIKEKDLNKTISKITDNLIDNGYTKENVVILVSTNGNIKEDNVKKIIEKSFNSKKIEYNILIQKTTEDSKELAEKYNVSESKASYIEEIIKNNNELKFEDLVDKSISELNSINHVEDKNDIVTQEDNNTTDNTNNSGNTNSNNNTKIVAPTSSQDKSGAWCTFNNNREAGSTFYYDEMLENDKAIKYYINYLGNIDYIEAKGGAEDDIRASYCTAYVYKVITSDYIYTGYIDSVTGSIIDSKKEELPKHITSQQAIDIALNHYGVTRDDLYDNRIEAIYGENFYPSLNKYLYRYQVNFELKDRISHSIDLNASDGSTIKENH